MEKIQNINDLVKYLNCDSIEELKAYYAEEIYPVTIKYDDQKITFYTDADRVPLDKMLRFPFYEDAYEDAIIGLQCVTDYALHEGYDNMHKDLFKDLALRYAEAHGVYEYKVNREYMEYWSLYEDGFYFYRVDLNSNQKEQVCFLRWQKEDGYPIPAFLLTEVTGYTKYNYFEG